MTAQCLRRCQPTATAFQAAVRGTGQLGAGARLLAAVMAVGVIPVAGGCSGCSKPNPEDRIPEMIRTAEPEPTPADRPPDPEAEAAAEPVGRDAEAAREPNDTPADPAPPVAGRARDAEGGADAGRRSNAEPGGRPPGGRAAGAGAPAGGPENPGAVLPGGKPPAPARAGPEAADFAGELLARARAAARAGDAAAAADLALEAYEQVLPHAATDPDCRRRVTEAEQLVGAVGGRAGPADSVPTRFE